MCYYVFSGVRLLVEKRMTRIMCRFSPVLPACLSEACSAAPPLWSKCLKLKLYSYWHVALVGILWPHCREIFMPSWVLTQMARLFRKLFCPSFPGDAHCSSLISFAWHCLNFKLCSHRRCPMTGSHIQSKKHDTRKHVTNHTQWDLCWCAKILHRLKD